MAAVAYSEEQLYTETQNRILTLIPCFTAPFSILGSGLIIYVAASTHRLFDKNNSYDRIMVGLSVTDILASIGLGVFGAWAVPENVPYVVNSRGNTTTCDIAGFLTHMYMGNILYTSALMIYFVLLVRLEWRPERIARRVEPWLHVVSMMVPIVSGSIAVHKGYMNPYDYVPGVCWIGSLPPTCDDSDEDAVECIRGNGGFAFARTVQGSASFVTIAIVVTAMIVLYLKVRVTEERINRYHQDGQQATFERTHRTALRGLAYVAAFFASFIPASVYQFVPRESSRMTHFLIAMTIVILLPLQGFFNAIIFLYPKRKKLIQNGQVFHSIALSIEALRLRVSKRDQGKSGEIHPPQSKANHANHAEENGRDEYRKSGTPGKTNLTENQNNGHSPE